MKSKIHLRIEKTYDYACNCQKRWGSTVITSTRNVSDVTCKNCLRTLKKE